MNSRHQRQSQKLRTQLVAAGFRSISKWSMASKFRTRERQSGRRTRMESPCELQAGTCSKGPSFNTAIRGSVGALPFVPCHANDFPPAPTTLHLVFTRTTSLCGVSVVHQARVLGLEPVEPSVCPYPRNYEREREEENEGTHPATWSCPSSSYLCKRILQYDATKHCLTSRYLFVVWRRLNPSVCSVGWQNVATLIYLKC